MIDVNLSRSESTARGMATPGSLAIPQYGRLSPMVEGELVASAAGMTPVSKTGAMMLWVFMERDPSRKRLPPCWSRKEFTRLSTFGWDGWRCQPQGAAIHSTVHDAHSLTSYIPRIGPLESWRAKNLCPVAPPMTRPPRLAFSPMCPVSLCMGLRSGSMML